MPKISAYPNGGALQVSDKLVIARAGNNYYISGSILVNLPDGTMLNGKIVPTVSANDLVLTLQTQAGATPSVSDPVLIKINGTWRSITAALTFTLADGTSWFKAGSVELGTRPIDYFAYLSWRVANSDVVLLASRIPYARLYSDFSGVSTNDKYAAFSAAPAGTDQVHVIGRFEATLSLVGTGHLWTIPTYTATNLIQRPIYETRLLTCSTVWTGYSVSPTSTENYRLVGRIVFWDITISVAGTSNATSNICTLPFAANAAAIAFGVPGPAMNNGAALTTPTFSQVSGSDLYFYTNYAAALWTAANGKYASTQLHYEI